MDPFVAVALSMLPASRSRVASAFKELRHQSDPGSDIGVDDVLEAVLEACEIPEDERPQRHAGGPRRAPTRRSPPRAPPASSPSPGTTRGIRRS